MTSAPIVFLDQFLEAHPDLAQSSSAFCDPKTYYVNLRRAFDEVERVLGSEVVIAAHPRAAYEVRDPRFGRRNIVVGETVDLVRRARLVLTHDSTSISFAVLYGKPVCFLTDDGIRRNDARRHGSETLASLLGKLVNNLDGHSQIDWVRECLVDEQRYSRYKEWYLKRAGSPQLRSWEFVAGYLKGSIASEVWA